MKRSLFIFILVFLLASCSPQMPATAPTSIPTDKPEMFPSPTQIPPTLTPGPTPTPWLDMILPRAVELCAKTESATGSLSENPDKRPVPTGYLILRKQADDTGKGDWHFYDFPQAEAQTPQDIHSLICITESFSASDTYEDGATGYSLNWAINMIDWSNEELVYVGTIDAGPPGIKHGSGNAYADEPMEDFAGLLDAVSRKSLSTESAGGTIATSADGSKLATYNPFEDALELLDTEADQLIWSAKREKKASGYPSTTPIFTADGRSIILGTDKGDVEWFDVEDGKISKISKIGDAIQGLALSPDGSLLAARDPDQIVVLNAANGSIQTTIVTSYHGKNSFAASDLFDLSFSTDNSLLATRSPANTVDIWDLSTKTIVHQIPGANSAEGDGYYRDCVQFLPDGKRLAVCDHTYDPPMPASANITFWNTTTWQQVGKIGLPDNIKDTMLLPSDDTFLLPSRNGRWLVVSTNCKVYLYGAERLQLERTILAETADCIPGSPTGFALTSDGKILWVSHPLLGFIPYEIP